MNYTHYLTNRRNNTNRWSIGQFGRCFDASTAAGCATAAVVLLFAPSNAGLLGRMAQLSQWTAWTGIGAEELVLFRHRWRGRWSSWFWLLLVVLLLQWLFRSLFCGRCLHRVERRGSGRSGRQRSFNLQNQRVCRSPIVVGSVQKS